MMSATVLRGAMKIQAHIVVRNPCPEHGYTHWDGFNRKTRRHLLFFHKTLSLRDPNYSCKGGLVAIEDSDDISVKALAQLIQINILALSGQSVTTVSNSAQAISVGDVPSAPVVVAGTTGTAPAFSNYALGDGTTNTDYHTTGSSYCDVGTVNAITSNTFTVTGTITNGSVGDILYKEIGLAVTVTHSASPYYFLLAHDYLNSGSGYTVSAGGTLAITYTATFT
jgi:hypothetical protein